MNDRRILAHRGDAIQRGPFVQARRRCKSLRPHGLKERALPLGLGTVISDEETGKLPSEAEEPDTVCSEEEFQGILAEQMTGLVHLANLVDRHPEARLSRRFHATLHEEAADTAELLEDYDAHYNRTFAILLELVIGLKLLSAAGHVLKTLQIRSARGWVPGKKDLAPEAEEAVRGMLDQVDVAERRLLRAVREESVRICGDSLATSEPARSFILQDGLHRKKLPHTATGEEAGDVEGQVASMASQFVSALKTFEERFRGRRVEGVRERWEIYERVCQEQQARFLGAKLENIQSLYDTFVRNSAVEHKDPRVAEFRHAVGMAVLFSRLVTLFIQLLDHFSEDGRNDPGSEKVRSIVQPDRVLDWLINVALFYTHAILEGSRPLAQDLIREYTTSETVELELPEGCVLHARPASMIAKIVAHHGTPVDMTMGSDTCYAGSLMKVILLAGSHLDERKVAFRGDRQPIRHIQLLFQHRLGEDGLEGLPDELSYLRQA